MVTVSVDKQVKGLVIIQSDSSRPRRGSQCSDKMRRNAIRATRTLQLSMAFILCNKLCNRDANSAQFQSSCYSKSGHWPRQIYMQIDGANN